MRLSLSDAIVGLVITLLPADGFAQKTPETIALTPASAEGALLMRVPIFAAPYTMMFSKDGKTGFGSRVYMMKVPAGERRMAYIGRTLRPGNYVLTAVFQQKIWGSCFHEGTIQFDIPPARVSYAGTFDTISILHDIQDTAVARHNTTMYAGTVTLGFHPDAHPEIAEPGAEEIAAARAFMADHMTRSSAPLEVVRPRPATLEVSKFNHAIGVCG